MNEIVIDAKDSVLGRLASFAAKQSLLGKKVIIVNCKDAIVTGRVSTSVEEYRQLRAKGGASLKGPIISKKDSYKFVKRTIRGMLSHKFTRGQEALDRIMCYNNTPKEYESAKKISFAKPLRTSKIKISEIMERI